MRFSTALREPTRRQVERLGEVDLLVGIPCFNNDATIEHVIRTVEEGLYRHYPDHRSVVLISDGGSTDDTREVAAQLEHSPWVERMVAAYRGVPGKGTAVRGIFEVADITGARATLFFDSDLRSITPEWVTCLADPVLHEGYDFIAPYYRRYKYDGTITNNIVYNLTRALYGYRVRQPIGGDFAFSLPLVRTFIQQPVWESDVARFGVDIWLTTTAMVHRVKMAQANLGVKIHDVKDPGEALGPMFRQVVATLLELMEEHEGVWKRVRGSEPVPVVGPGVEVEPQPFNINVPKLVGDFRTGFGNYGELWRRIVSPENWPVIEHLQGLPVEEFLFPTEAWVGILYDLAAAWHHWQGSRDLLLGLMTPLYFARIASFVNRTREMDAAGAEALVEEQAVLFEEMKGYLIERWDNGAEIRP
jgi:hypothetical protein